MKGWNLPTASKLWEVSKMNHSFWNRLFPSVCMQSSYTIIIHNHRTQSSYTIIIHNHHTQSSYQLMFHNECSWTSLLKYSRMNESNEPFIQFRRMVASWTVSTVCPVNSSSEFMWLFILFAISVTTGLSSPKIVNSPQIRQFWILIWKGCRGQSYVVKFDPLPLRDWRKPW